MKQRATKTNCERISIELKDCNNISDNTTLCPQGSDRVRRRGLGSSCNWSDKFIFVSNVVNRRKLISRDEEEQQCVTD